MPPVAPATLMAGMATASSFSAMLPSFRANWSAPPPAPQGTMKSMGRDGNFSAEPDALVSAGLVSAGLAAAAWVGAAAWPD